LRVPRTLLHVLAIAVTAAAILVPACAAQAEPTPGEVATQIEQANNELEKVIEAYNASNDALKQAKAAADDVTNRITALQSQLDAAYGGVQSLASAAYRGSGGMNTLSVLLSAGSTDQLVDQVTTLKYVNRSQHREITRYLNTKDKLGAERTRYDGLVNDQLKQQRQLADRKSTIEASLRDLEALKRRLNAPPPSSAGTSPPANPPAVSGSAGAAVSFAYAQLGKAYAWGAEGPSTYDCSGLTKASWANAGVSLPHNAEQQYNTIPHVSRANLQAGDLVFYSGLGHVAIYVGSSNVIHAPSSGDVVRVASVDMMTPVGYGRPG